MKSVVFLPLKRTSHSEALIKEATKDTRWGPTTAELNQLSRLSNHPRDLGLITKELSRKLRSKSPIQIHKALSIVLYMLQTSSSEFVSWLTMNQYSIRTLREYQIDTRRKHVEDAQLAFNIRNKASEILRLLENRELLRQKRQEFITFREEMKLPTPRSSLDMPSRSSFTGERNCKSLEINRAGLFRELDACSSSSDEERERRGSMLSNILELEEEVNHFEPRSTRI
ncbi:hypothetical protein KL908_001911 [Ogataea polymorpha]|nr:hypothetical protein KL908_001911 [Ogataea polymorpha]